MENSHTDGNIKISTYPHFFTVSLGVGNVNSTPTSNRQLHPMIYCACLVFVLMVMAGSESSGESSDSPFIYTNLTCARLANAKVDVDERKTFDITEHMLAESTSHMR